jgi:hypothetical protein
MYTKHARLAKIIVSQNYARQRNSVLHDLSNLFMYRDTNSGPDVCYLKHDCHIWEVTWKVKLRHRFEGNYTGAIDDPHHKEWKILSERHSESWSRMSFGV